MHNKSARNAMKLINNYQHFFKDYVKTIKEVSKNNYQHFFKDYVKTIKEVSKKSGSEFK